MCVLGEEEDDDGVHKVLFHDPDYGDGFAYASYKDLADGNTEYYEVVDEKGTVYNVGPREEDEGAL